MDRLTTGNAELDQVLAGGLPTGSLVVVAGPPGSGKTVLAQQIAFANGSQQHPALYYSTVSEPQSKMTRHLAGFSFFSLDAVGERVKYIQLSEYAGLALEDGLKAIVDEVLARTFRDEPPVVIIDSSRSLNLYGDAAQIRRTSFELASKIGLSGTVLVFVGEYTHQELSEAPEFSVADVIVELSNDPNDLSDRRTLRVAKLRGSKFLAGRHPFTIDADGLEISPRLDSLAKATSVVHEGRAQFAQPQLNTMTGGGLPRGDSTMIMGPTGCGKTTLAMHFVSAGLEQGESALYIALEENPAELLEKADAFGLGFTEAIDSGQLQLLHGPPGMTDLDRLGHQIRAALQRHRPRRVVVDAISSVMPAIRHEQRSPSYQSALSATLRADGATVIMTYEVRALGDNLDPVSDALSNLANNVLVLRYMERGSELGRVLSVLKMRRSDHDKGLLRYDVTGRGIEFLGEANDLSRITGWTVVGESAH